MIYKGNALARGPHNGLVQTLLLAASHAMSGRSLPIQDFTHYPHVFLQN